MIPVNEPDIGPDELASVSAAVVAGQVSSHGPQVAAFEAAWAAYCGRRHGIAVANGTVALELAVAALDLAPGDEVILPSFTIISCIQAVLYNGLVPKLVDVDPATWCIDPAAVARAVGPRTRAIMPVHMYGHPADMDPLVQLAETHGLRIIEDAAEAHGAEYHGRRTGSFGAFSCFSFYANKIITTGEGGMVLTDDEALADRARRLRNLAFGAGRRFQHAELGFNFRMTNLQAALGLPQVARIDTIVARKRWMGATYTERLHGVPGLQLPVESPGVRNVYWMYGVVVDESTGMDADLCARRLAELGVETRPFFLGMHEQEVFRREGRFADERYPVTERLARQGLYLPSGVALTEGQLDAVVRAVRQVLG